jgi:hypothetical protein
MSLLDGGTFTATNPEGEELLKTLLKLFPREPPVTTFVRSIDLPEAEIDFQRPVADIWPDVLDKAARAHKLRALVQAVANHPDSRAMTPYFAQVLAMSEGPGPVVDYYSAAFLPARRSLIDRVVLREHVRQLVAIDGPRVLVTSGATGSGKSHTWLFISYLGNKMRSFTPCLIDASRQAGAPMSAYDVIADIAGQLGWPQPPRDTTAQPATVVRTLVTWFIFKARDLDQQVWLVFDGFVDETADKHAQDLLSELAMAANRNEIPWVRVSLLEFGRPLDPDVELYALQEPLRRPSRPDYKEFFRAVAAEYHQDPTDEALDVLVTELLGEDGDGEHLTLAQLGSRASQLARAAFGEL